LASSFLAETSSSAEASSFSELGGLLLGLLLGLLCILGGLLLVGLALLAASFLAASS